MNPYTTNRPITRVPIESILPLLKTNGLRLLFYIERNKKNGEIVVEHQNLKEIYHITLVSFRSAVEELIAVEYMKRIGSTFYVNPKYGTDRQL